MQHPQRESHTVYLEPEGGDDGVVYPAGLSTSLPAAIQLEMLRTIPGLAQVEMIRPGYAVEYDYLEAGQLRPSLETKVVDGLFAAGQLNGSSGYEEAAGQGLVAGVNAARSVKGLPAWVPDPQRSYLGVLCRDLTGGGFGEPYRLLPARTEARLSLREGNAGLRLRAVAQELGVVEESRMERVNALQEEVARCLPLLDEAQLRRLRHPDLTLQEALAEMPLLSSVSPEAAREIYLDVRYAPYEAQRRLAEERLGSLRHLVIPAAIDYDTITGLSGEAVAALKARRPETVAGAEAVPGVSTASLAVLVAHLRRRERMKGSDVSRGTTG